jgi:hypothetical protein
MLANVVHMIFLAPIVLICDMLPIICVLRIEKNQLFLAHDFEHCTDNVDPKKNNKNLEACIVYYDAVKR